MNLQILCTHLDSMLDYLLMNVRLSLTSGDKIIWVQTQVWEPLHNIHVLGETRSLPE